MAVDNRLSIMHSQKPDVNRIMIVSASGTLYSSKTTDEYIDVKVLKEQPWFKNIEGSNGSLYVTELHAQAYVKNQPLGRIVTIGRYLKDSNGKFSGILLFDLSPESIIQLTEQQNSIISENGISLQIMNKNSQIIFMYPQTDTLVEEKPVNNDSLDIRQKSIAGETTINFQIPEEMLFSKLTSMRKLTALYFFGIMIIAVALSFVLSRTITLPIAKLIHSMNRVKKGDYTPVNIDQRNDEIGLLAETYNTMIATIKQLIEEVYISKLQKKNAQFQALQNQIHPHMLYNTLENIRMRAVLHEDHEVADMIKSLGKMFRLTLAKEKKQYLISDEIEYVTLYIQLLNARHPERYKFRCNLSDNLLSNRILRFAFQPIVENSIAHGFKNMEGECTIRIDAKCAGKGILIHIRDNGRGIEHNTLVAIRNELFADEKDLKEGGSGNIGLKNIYDRIKLEYGEDYYLDIASELGKGTDVSMMIPRSEV